MKAQTIRDLSLIAAMLAGLAGNLAAQSTFGSIRGTTVDQTGAALPQAAITLHNSDENTDASKVGDATGNFLFENLKPGHYRVTGQKEGFGNVVVDKIELAARQDIRLDLKFDVAATTQQLSVTADAVAVNTENATLSDSKINSDLTELPINSRAVSSSPLAALATSPSVTRDSQGNFAVGGATSSQTGFSVDGVSTTNVRLNGSLQDAYPSMEGIAEMKVTAFNNNAEFAQIGDVTFVTKSGTNQVHGSAYEYFQDRVLDATVLNFSSKAPKEFNTFGASLGGPVTIPKLYNGKDKTFFFVDYEGNRKTQSYPEQLLVPTQAERNGNLSALVAATGLPLINPFTGGAFPNNTIPTGTCPACINPVALALLNYYPMPNANLGIANPSYNYQTLVPTPSNTNGFDIRIDHNISSKQQIYVRYSFKNAFYTEYNDAGVIAPANDFLPNDGANEKNRSLVVSYNYSITPTLINEFRFGFTNYNENDTFPISGASAISQLGLDFNQPVGIASHPTADAFPTFSFSDGTVTSIGQDRVGPTISGNIQFTDNITKTIGKHTFRFGVDVRREHFNALMYYLPSDDFGNFTFSGSLTNYSIGDFLLGLANPSYFAVTGPQMDARTVQYGLYGQDTWQANSHLTVNFGLRWEYLPAFQESNGDIADFLVTGTNQVTVVVPNKFYPFIANNSTYQQIYTGFLQGFNACVLTNRNLNLPCSNIETASQAGLPQGLRFTPGRNFDPRVSIAWRPFNNNKTVIRAGFGLYTMTTLGPMSFNSGIIALSDLLTYNNSVTNGVAAFQFPQVAPPGAAASFGGGDFEEANNPYWKDPTSAQWNMTVERQLTDSTILRLSYTGQESYHLPITIDLNQIPASTTPYTIPNNGYSVVDPRAPYQNWNLLMDSESIGTQSFNAATAEVTSRASHGLTFQANYTFAKNISDAQGTDAPTAYAGEEPYAVEIANAYDIKYDRGNVVGMPRQRFLLTGSYLLPGPDQAHKFLSAVAGGWTFSTVTTIQTGQWLTPTMPAADDQSNTNMLVRNTGGAIARPDCVGNPYANQTSQQFYNPSAFALPPVNAGRFGNCGVGILEGPHMIDFDAGLAKRFNIGERFHVRFEATFTNVINHTNFAPPVMNIASPSFGVLQSALPQGAGGNRTGQLGLRVDF